MITQRCQEIRDIKTRNKLSRDNSIQQQVQNVEQSIQEGDHTKDCIGINKELPEIPNIDNSPAYHKYGEDSPDETYSQYKDKTHPETNNSYSLSNHGPAPSPLSPLLPEMRTGRPGAQPPLKSSETGSEPSSSLSELGPEPCKFACKALTSDSDGPLTL